MGIISERFRIQNSTSGFRESLINFYIILTVAMQGCETLSPVLREECSLREFESRILGQKWD